MRPRKNWTIAESYHSLIHFALPRDVPIIRANPDDLNVPREESESDDRAKQVRRALGHKNG